METKQIKSVWILSYTDPGYDGQRIIYGAYADEDLANDALNDEILLPNYSGPNPSDAEVEELFNRLNPEIEELQIKY